MVCFFPCYFWKSKLPKVDLFICEYVTKQISES